MAENKSDVVVSAERLMNDLWAGLASQALISGIELRVFNQIAAGKRTAEEVAKAVRASKRGVRTLLDALAALGYLSKAGEKYKLDPVADTFLVQGKPTYMGDLAYATKLTYSNWAFLTEAVKSGNPYQAVDAEERGKEFFPKLVPALFRGSYAASRAALNSLPRKTREGIKTILDVAAGSGAWSMAFAHGIPEAHVTVVDYPEVTPITRDFAKNGGVGERYHYKEGNLRELDFGKKEFDLVLLGHIIHSEGEKWGRKLIKKSFDALRPGGLLLIGEMVPNDSRTGPRMPLLFGLNMLMNTADGDVFTMKQYRQWLKSAGFKSVKTISAPAPSPLILATK